MRTGQTGNTILAADKGSTAVDSNKRTDSLFSSSLGGDRRDIVPKTMRPVRFTRDASVIKQRFLNSEKGRRDRTPLLLPLTSRPEIYRVRYQRHPAETSINLNCIRPATTSSKSSSFNTRAWHARTHGCQVSFEVCSRCSLDWLEWNVGYTAPLYLPRAKLCAGKFGASY